MFLNGKNDKFLEFSKSLSLTLNIQQFDYEYIATVQCTSEKGQMTKVEKVANSHNCNFMGVGVLYLCKNNLLKTLTKAIMFVK